MWTFSRIWGPQHEFNGQTFFEITVLPGLLDKMRTFYPIWGHTRRKFSGPSSCEITVLPALLDKMRTFYVGTLS